MSNNQQENVSCALLQPTKPHSSSDQSLADSKGGRREKGESPCTLQTEKKKKESEEEEEEELWWRQREKETVEQQG